jgi:hypothetical protein
VKAYTYSDDEIKRDAAPRKEFIATADIDREQIDA